MTGRPRWRRPGVVSHTSARTREQGGRRGSAHTGWPRSPLSLKSLAAQVFLLQVVVVLLLLIGATAALVLQGRYDSSQDAAHRSLAAAEAFAHAPGTALALRSSDPGAVLQSAADKAQKGAGVDFIAVLSTEGIRYTDPERALIGRRVEGDITRAAAGEAFTETFTGEPHDAVRALVPVTDADGKVVGLISAGIQIANVGDLLNRQLPVVLGSAAGALVLATGGVALVSRRLQRQTHGLGPAEMTRMYEHHDSVLHAVREGVVIVGDGRLVLANDEARRLLDLPADADGRPVPELNLSPGIAHLLDSGETVSDKVFLSGDRLLAVNTRPTAPHGGFRGMVASLRDTTELRALSGRAEVARERLTLLYEAGVRIGTTLDVRQTARELAAVAVPRFADFVTVELLDPVLRGDEPTGALGEMRRTALSGIRDDHPLQPVGDVIRFVIPTTPMARALERGHAVLEADLASAHGWEAQDPAGAREALEYGVRSLISVPLQARGVVLGMVNYWRSVDAPRFDEDDASFAEELATRAAVAIDNARRFTREHAMAVTLQRSLLPRDLPEQDALEVAWRYLPAQAGVGGDWFDVIPLPGFRVALVVGDVVGHGMHAAATMGRLRTAVLNFSSLDLPPADLLAHLDDLVSRIDAEQTVDGDRVPVSGATCLYAIYDLVSGRCTVAHAGHPAPALVAPGRDVTYLELPVSPPLGIGAPPFEETELDLPEGSRLVLFTDGLVEERHRDIDEGLEALRAAIAPRDMTPEETCRAVTDAMLTRQPSDDIALLVARTRLIQPENVAVWEVPFDVSSVSRVRAEAREKLAAWGLEDLAFAVELILSELLTNAIRYGSAPVQVRLLRGRTLVCEVSDGSNTSPHMRRAATTDEGGRGIFLVSQFSQRWGTRYVAQGKIIWAELSLSAEMPDSPMMMFDALDGLDGLDGLDDLDGEMAR